jgi:putative radical SAM enzyme (TIGR03279 family)
MTDYYPATITGVSPDSAARRCGLRAGDRLLAFNETPLRDVIDVQFYGGEDQLSILYERGNRRRRCKVRRRYGEPLGIDFAQDLFSGEPRLCRNNCEFCFVTQMPAGLRQALYVKDDDYRLSFLHGNYITLTNLDETDWERIEAQYLSPLYVSVHATEPEIRVGLMKNPRAREIVTQLRRLAEMGIEVHTQAVLVPGRNDGAHLDRTIQDLVGLHPAIQTLSVVPVGLTRWCNPEMRTYTEAEATEVLGQVEAWHTQLRAELGVGFVYPSDEWYLRAALAVPEVEVYDNLLPAMIENGVGMVRRFLDGREKLTDTLDSAGDHQIWVTGTLFAPILSAYAGRYARQTGRRVEVVPVVNRFFGDTVTVAGLLTAQDVLAALSGLDLGSGIVLPGEMFRGPEGRSLDGQTPEFVQSSLGVPVYLVSESGRPGGAVKWSITQNGAA